MSGYDGPVTPLPTELLRLDAPPTVHEAIRRVMADLGAIGRGGEMTHGEHYRYRKVDDILERVHPLLVEHGVLFVPRVIDKTHEQRVNRAGNPQAWVSLTVEWIITGPMGDALHEDGRLPSTVGEAADSSDKSANKAMTAAQKLAFSQVLSIPYSAPDPDDERPDGGRPPLTVAEEWKLARPDEVRRATDEQERLDNLPADLADKVLARMSARVGVPVTRVGDAPPAWLPHFGTALDKAWEAVEVADEDPDGEQG